jgi:hypothetical protein
MSEEMQTAQEFRDLLKGRTLALVPVWSEKYVTKSGATGAMVLGDLETGDVISIDPSYSRLSAKIITRLDASEEDREAMRRVLRGEPPLP